MRRLFVILALTMSSVLSTQAVAGASTGYGTPVGRVTGCAAKVLDKSTLPLIVILLKQGVPYAWYNVTSDPGTTAYHFDVPAGRYQLMTTYTGTASYPLRVRVGKSPRTDLRIACHTNDH